MNKRTIWRQLNTAQLILIALLLVGVGLALWIERTRSLAAQSSDQLASKVDRIHYDLTLMSVSVRGLLLDPKSEIDEKHRSTAESDLTVTIDNLQDTYRGREDLMVALRNMRDFVTVTLRAYHADVIRMLKADPTAALEYYNKNDQLIRKRRDDSYSELARQVLNVSSDEQIRAQNIAVEGGVFIVVVLIATFIVGRFQHTSVSEPLALISTAFDRMRRGDFTQRIHMHRDDEFGVLGENLNRLADDLSVLVGQVQRSGIQVNTTTTEIAATAKEQQSTANQIAATTAEIGATSKEISATSKELDKTMNEVSQVAEDTAQLANSGQNAIGRMESTMRQITEASSAITAKLAALSEKTANINSVVTTITKVADQTNLLSLNAAIEAEKAGEYGLGFAVVAMEIRRLADQTAVATYDIEKMVKEMQSAVAAGVMGMDKFSEEARRGVEEIRQVSTQLAQIIHQVQTLTPRFQTVNEGMHAQATGAQQISETLTQLSEAAQQTAESLRQSNLAIEQLNDAARGLQTSVTRFKLEARETMLFLLFQIGNDRYALEASHAVEVIPLLALKKVPHAPRGVAGIFNYRGQPVPALDLCELTLGRPSRERLSTRIILVNYSNPSDHSRRLGLIAEHATEMMRRDECDFVDSGVKVGTRLYLGPVLMDDKGVIQLLHAQHLMAEGMRDLLFAETSESSHEPR